MTSWQDDRGESGRPVVIVVANLVDVAKSRCEYSPIWPGCPFILDLSDPGSIDITSGLESFSGHYEKRTEIGHFCFEIGLFTHFREFVHSQCLSDHRGLKNVQNDMKSGQMYRFS